LGCPRSGFSDLRFRILIHLISQPSPTESVTLVFTENENPIMPHPQIKFGTDGWRGLIADDFT
jgi:hypothetical protein